MYVFYNKVFKEFAEMVEHLKNELLQRETELERQAMELHHVRCLMQRHLHITLRKVRNLEEMNLKLKVLFWEELNVYFMSRQVE